MTVAVAEAESTSVRWQEVTGGSIPAVFVTDPANAVIIEVDIEVDGQDTRLTPGDFI